LRADLELRRRLLTSCKFVDLQAVPGWSLSGWQSDTALAPVRDRAELTKLPLAAREEWQRLWADVATQLPADPLDQGLMEAGQRQWSQAAACYERALKHDATDGGHSWFEYAALLLLSGDRQGYERACAHMVARCGQSPALRPYHVARTCTLSSGAVTDASQPGRLARSELQSASGQFWSLTEQGALLYRAGQFQNASMRFEESLRASSRPGEAILNWLWLALARQRLGKADEARRWLGKATAWLDQYRNGLPARAEEELGLHFHNWLEANVLRREAEAIVRPADRR
jgi:tetratricopeptide (TPR) repeat protein